MGETMEIKYTEAAFTIKITEAELLELLSECYEHHSFNEKYFIDRLKEKGIKWE